jgi:hypothetical protein
MRGRGATTAGLPPSARRGTINARSLASGPQPALIGTGRADDESIGHEVDPRIERSSVKVELASVGHCCLIPVRTTRDSAQSAPPVAGVRSAEPAVT